MAATKIINFNVGGRQFSTTMTTLMSHPDSVLARMFGSSSAAAAANSVPPECSENSSSEEVGMAPAMRDSTGAYFIDRDPDTFAVLLNYLRTGRVPVALSCSPTKEQLRDEALYFGLDRLAEEMQSDIDEEQQLPVYPEKESRQILVVDVRGDRLVGPVRGLNIGAGIHLFKSSPICNSLGVDLPIVAAKDSRSVLFCCPGQEDRVPVAEAVALEQRLLKDWKFYWAKAEIVEPGKMGMHKFGDL